MDINEKLNFGEQPDGKNASNTTEVDLNIVDNNFSSGSPVGKFKDATGLLNAYNELQSEFTRKCQKLSELEKSDNENLQNSSPFDWQKNVSEFFNSHKLAKNLMTDIANELINDDKIMNNKNALDLAYNRALEKNYVDKNELINDENFINENILKNEKICDKVIKKYLDNIKNKSTPSVLSASIGGQISISKNAKPTTLQEANKIMEEMLKK